MNLLTVNVALRTLDFFAFPRVVGPIWLVMLFKIEIIFLSTGQYGSAPFGLPGPCLPADPRWSAMKQDIIATRYKTEIIPLCIFLSALVCSMFHVVDRFLLGCLNLRRQDVICMLNVSFTETTPLWCDL